MKNKKNRLIVLIIVLLLTTTGCTTQLKDSKNKVVKNSETGQTLPSNILCKPTSDIYKLYEKTNTTKKVDYKKIYKDGKISKEEYQNKIKSIEKYEKYLSKLPRCNNFKVTSGEYEGIWTSVFVKPLAWFIIKIGNIFKNYGISIILITVLIRTIMLPITIKTANQSESLKKAQPELNKLEKKYKDNKDQQAMMMKSQEMMAIYKKYKINPMMGCLFGFLQIPLFFAFYESLSRLPAIFEGKFLFYELSTTPIIGASKGNYLYLVLPVMVLLVTYYSFKQTNAGSTGNGQEKQMKIMLNIMTIMIFATSFTMSTAIVLYWITNSTFTIAQNFIVKRSKKND